MSIDYTVAGPEKRFSFMFFFLFELVKSQNRFVTCDQFDFSMVVEKTKPTNGIYTHVKL